MSNPYISKGKYKKIMYLLDMMYRPSELSDEIGITTETICRVLIPAGAPHSIDPKGDTYIHGIAFKKWVEDYLEKKDAKKITLPENYGYCTKCRKGVEMVKTTIVAVSRNVEMRKSKCPYCGSVVNRAQRKQVKK